MPKKKEPSESSSFDFETALKKLNQLVEKMEQGGLALEEAVECYKEGIILTRLCQQALNEAEQKVQILSEKNGEIKLKTYKPEE